MTKLGERSLSGTNIVDIVITPQIVNIGKEALKDCTSLKILNYPNHLITFTSDMMSGCSKLEQVTITKSATETTMQPYSS